MLLALELLAGRVQAWEDAVLALYHSYWEYHLSFVFRENLQLRGQQVP